MIVRHRVRPQSTRLQRLAVVLAALLLLPLAPGVQADGPAGAADPAGKAAATPVATPAAAGTMAVRLGAATQRGAPLAFTPDNKGLFTIEPMVIRLWDIAGGKLIREFRAADRAAFQFGAVLTPDGKALVGNAWGHVSVWDVETGKLRKTCAFSTGNGAFNFQNFVLMPDGKTAVWLDGQSQEIIFWDIETDKARKRLKIPPGPQGMSQSLSVFGFSRDGKRMLHGGNWMEPWDPAKAPAAFPPVVVALDQAWTFHLWDLETKQVVAIREFRAKRDANSDTRIDACAFSPDGKTCATLGASLRTWDAASGKELAKYDGKDWQGYGGNLAFSADGKTLTMSQGRDVRRFEVSPDGLRLLSQHEIRAPQCRAVLSLDGRLVAFGSAATQIMDATTWEPVGTDVGHVGTVRTVAFMRDGRTFATLAEDGECRLWETATGKLLRTRSLHVQAGASGALRQVSSVAPDGSLAASSLGMHPVVTDLGSNKMLWEAGGVGRRVDLLAFSPDGKWLAGAGRVFPRSKEAGPACRVSIWDSKTGGAPKIESLLKTINAQALCWSPDGSLVGVGTQEGMLYLVSATDGDVVRVIAPLGAEDKQASVYAPPSQFDAGIYRAELSPDSRLAALLVQNGELVVLEVASGKELYRLKTAAGGEGEAAPTVRDRALAFAPDSRTMATAAGQAIYFWDAASGAAIERIDVPAGRPLAAAFSPDGRLLLTGGEAEGTALWHTPAAKSAAAPAGADLPKLWDALASEKPLVAWQAIATLAAGGEQAAQFLGQRLPATGAADPGLPKKVAELVEALDDQAFKRREKATQELKALGRRIHPLLRQALKKAESVEVRRQLHALLAEVHASPSAPVPQQDLQAFRVVAALERIGGPAAATVLQKVADSSADGRLVADAQAALRRLKSPPDK